MFDYLKKYIGWKCTFNIDTNSLFSLTGELKEIEGAIAVIEDEEGFGKKKKKVEKIVNLNVVQSITPIEKLNRYGE